jgi:hypothetical protein
MKLPVVVMTIVCCAIPGLGQDVLTSQVKEGVNVSITANQSYELMAGEKKRAVLSVQCAQNQKATKSMHLVMFTAGDPVAEGDPTTRPKNGAVVFDTDLGGSKERTTWIPYGDAITYAYYGKTEPERVKFLQLLLAAPTFSIEFTPFLTGKTAKADFDIVKLRTEVNRHPECLVK